MTLVAETDSPNRLDSAAAIISSACGWSVAASLVPLPILDLAALAAVQANMINEIAGLYGQSFAKDAVKSAVSVLLGTLVPGTLGSGLKSIPGVGTVAGMVTFGAFAAASTYAVGKVMVKHFETGGTTASFNPKNISEDLKREFSSAQKKPV